MFAYVQAVLAATTGAATPKEVPPEQTPGRNPTMALPGETPQIPSTTVAPGIVALVLGVPLCFV